MQFRSFGGTVGLAQCAAVLNGKVTSAIARLLASGVLSADEAAAVARAAAAGMDSLASIDALPAAVQALVRDAFRQGTRWAFISLVPWAGLGFLASLFLSKIHDADKQQPQEAHAEKLEYDSAEGGLATQSMKLDGGSGRSGHLGVSWALEQFEPLSRRKHVVSSVSSPELSVLRDVALF